MPYSFVEGATMADVAFEATGKNLEELFESAGKAVTKSMIENIESIEEETSVEFSLNHGSVDRLLHDFLDELVYYKDAENLFFSGYMLKIRKEEGKYYLEAMLKGEKINPDKHELVVNVKAVSWHKYEVKKKEDAWKAFVILDV
ncbi:archease [Candidatus Micrarchaeota archaeon]|nr:archease [Candidatus Micrarchaeota archaeon]